ncbi:MAG: hypothetical protein KF900_11525 [Bacteroidetes bacterium]|nr:hypothetical protein [Bacteroidota bacterium]
MNTTKNNQSQTAAGVDGWFNRQAEKFEASRFFWMSIYLTVQSCLGSVACMYILKNNASDIMLVSCAAVTMGANAVFISQGPGKWCLLSFYISVLLNLFFIFTNI